MMGCPRICACGEACGEMSGAPRGNWGGRVWSELEVGRAMGFRLSPGADGDRWERGWDGGDCRWGWGGGRGRKGVFG